MPTASRLLRKTVIETPDHVLKARVDDVVSPTLQHCAKMGTSVKANVKGILCCPECALRDWISP